MRHLTMVLLSLMLGFSAVAQLPNGSICPNFTATDINGNSWNLYSLLDEGKHVILVASATWSGPDWNYFNSGELQAFYNSYGPTGSNQATVLYIEADETTTLADLQGTGSSTQGDFVTGTPFPIIDDASLQTLLGINYFPTVYGVCANSHIISELGQLTSNELMLELNGICDSLFGFEYNVALIGGSFSTLGEYCGSTSAPLSVEIINNGFMTLTTCTVTVSVDGNVVQTYEWTGSLGQTETTVVSLNDLELNGQNAQVSVTLSNPNGQPDEYPMDNVYSTSVSLADAATTDLLQVEILTDQFGMETSWEMFANGVLVAEGPGATGYNPNTAYTTDVPMPIQPNTCIELRVYDSFGDGVCCSFGEGYIHLKANNTVVASFTDFSYLGSKMLSVTHPASAGYIALSGNVYHDVDGSGTNDGEPNMPQILVQSDAGTFASTDNDGNYTIYVPAAGNTVTAVAPQYATATPASYVVTAAADTLDFAMYYTPGITDMAITQTATPVFRPGFNTYMTITVSNLGVDDASGQVFFVPPAFTTVVNNSPSAFVSGDTLSWDYATLEMGQSLSFMVTLMTATTTEIGTPVLCQAWVTTVADDDNGYNNHDNLNDVVVGSYDPNDKRFEPANYTDQNVANGDPIVYTIRFQNTGNFPADFVRIVDTLPQNADISTFRVLSGSHPYTWTMTGTGIVEFMFANIMLPDSFSNEPESHGFIKYEIHPREGIEIGESLYNTAYIFFDFNEPVITNTAVTTVEMTSGSSTPTDAQPLGLLPNPTDGMVRVVLPQHIGGTGVLQVISAQGQRVLQQNTTSHNETIDLTNLPNGVYLIQWNTNGERYVGKVIKR